MKKILVVIFLSIFLNADEWNQPQIDKATAFQKQFNGSERVQDDTFVNSKSSSNGYIYIAFGAAFLLLSTLAGYLILKKQKISESKQAQAPSDS